MAIDMPMNIKAVIIYLAIVLAGYVVVSIADSFAPPQISTRLRISNARIVFTQVHILSLMPLTTYLILTFSYSFIMYFKIVVLLY